MGTFFKNGSGTDWSRESLFNPILSNQGLLLGSAIYPAHPKHECPLYQQRNTSQSLGNKAQQGWNWGRFAPAALLMVLRQRWGIWGQRSYTGAARTVVHPLEHKGLNRMFFSRETLPSLGQHRSVRWEALQYLPSAHTQLSNSLAAWPSPGFVPLVLGNPMSKSGRSKPGWGTQPCLKRKRGIGAQEIQHSPLRSRHTEQHVHTERGAEH